MKHPTRHISGRLQKVSRGRQVLSREITRTVKRIKNDPLLQRLATELTKHLAEMVLRVVVLSAVNQCLRTRLPAREQTRVVPIRPKPTVVA
jgi:hypothetical protein